MATPPPYIKPLLIIFALFVLITFLVGTYFEEYESTLNTLVQGTFSETSYLDWSVDTHFLLFSVYGSINKMAPNISVYGFVLTLLNFLAITGIGITLFRLLFLHLKIESYLVFCLLLFIISFDSIVNLGSTRIVFLLVASVFILIESFRANHESISKIRWVFLVSAILIASFIRAETALLAGLLYVVLIVLHQKFHYSSILLFSISAGVFLGYNLFVTQYMSEGRLVYFKYEFDIIDRNNIRYSELSQMLLLEINAFKNYLLSDEIHYTQSFYESIIDNKSRFAIDNLWTTFNHSLKSYHKAWLYVAFAFITSIRCLIQPKTVSKKWFFHHIFLLLFPIAISFYLTIPERFLILYFGLLGVSNLIFLFYSTQLNRRLIAVAIVFCLLFLLKGIKSATHYQFIQKQVEATHERLTKLSVQYSENTPFIINKIEYLGKFNHLKPLSKTKPQDALFLNFWYYESFNSYLESWKNVCNCNGLSLIEKLNYIAEQKKFFIVGEEDLKFLKEYTYTKYNLIITANLVEAFDDELNIYTIQLTDR